MIIERTSPLTGKVNQMDLPVTQERIDRWAASDELIQNVFPQLNAEQREFLMSGYTQEDWDTIFPPEEEDECDCDDEPVF
jgi:hypothetical protein